MKRLATLGACALLLLVPACGGDAPPANLDGAGAALGSAFCKAAVDCAGSMAEAAFGDPARCTDEWTKAFEDALVARWRAEIHAGTAAYDPERLTSCLHAIEAEPCIVTFTTKESRAALPPACDDVLEGKVALGGSCEQDEACAGEAYCDAVGLCPGACARRGASGAECLRDGQCRSGLQCAHGRCEAPAGRGEACGAGEAPECGLGLLCAGETAASPGTCEEPSTLQRAGVGAPCGEDAGELCRSDLFCVAGAIQGGALVWTCVGPSASGGECNAGPVDPCPRGEYCAVDPAVGAITGTCRPLSAVGAACVMYDSESQCVPGAVCDAPDAGECVPKARLGLACAVDRQCYSGRCDGGTCVVPRCL